MPEYLAPGVYVEEISFESHPIEGVSTSTAGLVGVTVAKVRKCRSRCLVILTKPKRKGRLCVARMLAHELRQDLYRVDLAAVISKYIGETEKNLRRLFGRAQKNGAVLFFDEADALFRKRSAIKDASDRLAHFNSSWFLEQLKAFAAWRSSR
jgi:phage tail sheath protein FI